MTIKDEVEALCTKYGVDKKISVWLLGTDGFGMVRMEDLMYALKEEPAAAAMVKAAGISGTGPELQQASRLRQAYAAMKKAEDEQDAIKKRGMDETDLDSLLPQLVLDDMGDRHYTRYHMCYPPWIFPSDQLLSRLSREMDKRLLRMQDVFKVRSQAQMSRAQKKKTVLDEGVEVTHNEADDHTYEAQTLKAYLSKLLTLIIAYVVAGSRRLTNQPATAEKRGLASTAYVDAPMDVMFRYYYRVQKFALDLPGSIALKLTQSRDEAEREVWVDRHRNSEKTLGEIVMQAMETRDALWQIPEDVREKIKLPISAPDRSNSTSNKRDREGKPKGKMSEEHVSYKFKNGTALCKMYQWGQCSNQNCGRKHLCGRIYTNGRVCGQRHPAISCTHKMRKGKNE